VWPGEEIGDAPLRRRRSSGLVAVGGPYAPMEAPDDADVTGESGPQRSAEGVAGVPPSRRRGPIEDTRGARVGYDAGVPPPTVV
jgi:hypothetical protein